MKIACWLKSRKKCSTRFIQDDPLIFFLLVAIARELIPSVTGIPQIALDLRLPSQDEQAGCQRRQSHLPREPNWDVYCRIRQLPESDSAEVGLTFRLNVVA
jgi:hypothetical protein